MTNTPLPLRIVILCTDSHEGAQVNVINQGIEPVVVHSCQALQQELIKHAPAGIVLGKKSCTLAELVSLKPKIDFSTTALLAGPFSAQEGAVKLEQCLGNNSQMRSSPSVSRELTLEDYIESKLGEFVRAMKVSSARSMYPTFMRAVERPLIELALKETNGNQIQASQLLGMNRNTLRKKIGEFKISVKRRRKDVRVKEKKSA